MSDLLSLRGKVALITGASQGQGAAEAELFAAQGAKVVLSDVSDDAGKALAARIEGAAYVHLDVGKEADWQAAVKFAQERFGRLDILVNNAGIMIPGSIDGTTQKNFERVAEINLTGAFLGMQTVRPAMQKAGGGAIVNIASIGGLTGRSGIAAYVASKWGLRGLGKSAALEFAADKIRVNTVCPGFIDTAMSRASYPGEKMAQRGKAVPLGRYGEVSDIANAVLFLVSDASSFITGAELVVDGGETAGQKAS